MRRSMSLRRRPSSRIALRLRAGVIASGSTLTWMMAGMPEASARSKAGTKSAVVVDGLAVAAEGAGIGGEIGVASASVPETRPG